MKRQKALRLAGLAIVLLVLAAEGILVYRINSHAMQNVVTVGNVNIHLTEPEYERQRDEEESESETGQAIVVENVKPGEKILRDPTIVVEEGSQTAYLRTRIVVKGLTEYQKNDLLEHIELASGWNYNTQDGYYYFKNPVTAGDKVNFFSGVTIPGAWKRMTEGVRFQISVLAEAVQASYLTPNINSDCQMIGWIPTEILLQTKRDLIF